jgi:hypothetical protein
MIKKIKCKDCQKEIEIDTQGKYKRKYCKECSKKRKEDYDNLYKVSADECEEA